MFPSYRNQSVDCRANEVTAFYVMGTSVVKGLSYLIFLIPGFTRFSFQIDKITVSSENLGELLRLRGLFPSTCYASQQRKINVIAAFKPIMIFVYKMVKHTIKILQQMLQFFQCVFDDFMNTRQYRVKRCMKYSESRSSHRRCSTEKVFLKISQNSQKNTCTRVSFFNKVVGLRPATLLKNRLLHKCFPAIHTQFLRAIFTEHLRETFSVSVFWRQGQDPIKNI